MYGFPIIIVTASCFDGLPVCLFFDFMFIGVLFLSWLPIQTVYFCYLTFACLFDHPSVCWFGHNKLLHMDLIPLTSVSLLENTLPEMDPVEVSQLQAAFAYQSEVLQGFQGQLTNLRAANEHLT